MFRIFSSIYEDIFYISEEICESCNYEIISRFADKEEYYINKIVEARDIKKLSDDEHFVSEYNSLLSLKLPKRIVCSDGIRMLLNNVSFSEGKPLLYTCEYKSLDTERTITITGRSPLSVLRQAEALAVPDPNDFDETSEPPY